MELVLLGIFIYGFIKAYNERKSAKPPPIPAWAIKPPRIIHIWPTYDALNGSMSELYDRKFQPCCACGKQECAGICEETTLQLLEHGIISTPKPDWMIWN